MRRIVVPLLLSLLLLASCAGRAGMGADIESKPRHIRLSYQIADNLDRQLRAKRLGPMRIIKVVFVDIDDVNTSSSAGRIYPEIIGSRLAQLGYEIVELKLRTDSIRLSPKMGETLLSYDRDKLRKNYNASAALVGYYKRYPYQRQTMLYARIINLENNTIMAGDDVGIRD